MASSFLDFMTDAVDFSFHRLAEDMLAHLYKLFRIQDRLIPPPRYAENEYKYDEVIQFICRITKLDQITHRRSFNLLFLRNDAAVRCMNDCNELAAFVTSCVHSIRDETRAKGKRCDAQELFNLSIACVVELSLFYVSEGHDRTLKKMAGTWLSYFDANLRENSDFTGLVTRMLGRIVRGLFLEMYLDEFIPKFCVPYVGEDVYIKFLHLLPDALIETATAVKHSFEERGPLSLECSHEESVEESMPLEVHERLGLVPPDDFMRQESEPKPSEKPVAAPKRNLDAVAIAALKLAQERKKGKKSGMGRSGVSTAKSRHRKADSKVPGPSREKDTPETDSSLDQTPDLDRSSESDSQTTPQPTLLEREARPKDRRTRKR